MTPEELEALPSDNNSDPPLIHIATAVPEATLRRDVVPHDLRANPTADVATVLESHAENSANSCVFYALDSNQHVVGYLDYTICSNRTDEAGSVQPESACDELMLVVKHLAAYAQGPDVQVVIFKLIKYAVQIAMDVSVLVAVEVIVEAKSQDPCGVFCTKANALVEGGFRMCEWRALPTVEPEFYTTWRQPLVPPLDFDD